MSKPAEKGPEPAFGSPEYRAYFRDVYVRKEARGRFCGFQDGKRYLAAIFLVLGSIPVLLTGLMAGREPSGLALVPVYFLVCNLLEYLLHRYPMHNKTRHLEFFFEHVTVHHNFYGEELYYYEEPRDYMAVFLPLLYFLYISILLALCALGVYLVSDWNNALLFLVVGYAYYLMYEALHFAYHARETSLLKKIPFVRRLSGFHLQHHRHGLMARYNFNITFPIFDMLFGTLYDAKTCEGASARKVAVGEPAKADSSPLGGEG